MIKLTNNDKIWLMGSLILGAGLGFDVGLATGVATFGAGVMCLGFMRGFILSLDHK